jgi:nuclear cap-binding protein subunit 2
LAFSTRSRHVRAHFAQIGPVRSVQMGLDRLKKTPCGFCFVEYHYRTDALAAVANLSGTKLDGRVIRVELDAGFQPGRQYGRGLSGGQVRDDRRTAADPARKRDRDAEGQPSRTEGNSSSGAGAGGGGYYGPGDEPSAKRQRT